MQEAKKIAERAEPKRWLTKKEGLRHLIHASIRLVFKEEDTFATHVLAQSAEKILIDLLKRAEIDDPFSFEHLLVPEHKREFFELYREPYNFLKHADKDHDGKLPVYEIVRSNDVLLLGCIARYQKLFQELTVHMGKFLSFCMTSYPSLVKWDQIPQGVRLIKLLSEFGKLPRGEVLAAIRAEASQDPQFLQEQRDDLIDVREARSAAT